MPGTHPIKDHISCLPDPHVVRSLLGLQGLYPEFLVRSLDQNAHLSYHTQTVIGVDLGHHYSISMSLSL